jgi:dihydroorotate dehydrogenase (fumarate)
MDLSTTYLGLKLPHPFVPGASPLSDHLDAARRLEDAGAPAIVMRSLFEEQIARERLVAFVHTHVRGSSFAEALASYPPPGKLVFGPEEYLEHLGRLKQALKIPVIASLNGSAPGGWLDYPPLIEKMGADALELNLYNLIADPGLDSTEAEKVFLDVVGEVKKMVRIPVAVKISPFFSSLAHFARSLAGAGADGLVLFNRFYEPDVEDPTGPRMHLSSRAELSLRLRWISILSGRLRPSLAVTGGVHGALDGVKAVLVGAHAVQVVSCLLINGPEYLWTLRRGMERWMEERGWDSVAEMRGSLSLLRCPDPGAYERANYMLALQGHGPGSA